MSEEKACDMMGATSLLSELYARLPQQLWITLCTIGKDGKLRSKWFQTDQDGLNKLAIEGLSAATDFDVFFSVCPALAMPEKRLAYKRISQKDVACVPALFIDVDTLEDTTKAGKKLPENKITALECLNSLTILPSSIVDSGHGLHVYWLLEEPLQPKEGKQALKNFANTIKQITGWFDLDSSASEPARILRLPGTFNHKEGGSSPVKIVVANQRRYNVSDLVFLTKNKEPEFSDEALIARATSAKNGQRFSSLWTGDISGYQSQSEADLALACQLAFWTSKDAVWMDRLFRQSKLMRAKWNEPHNSEGKTYGVITVNKAIDLTVNTYNPRKKLDYYDDNSAKGLLCEAFGRVKGYGMRNGEIVVEKITREGDIVYVSLSTFSALIRKEIVRDDGDAPYKEFEIEGFDKWGNPLPVTSVKASAFARLDWVGEAWGTKANIYPGASVKDKLRFGIIEASEQAEPPMQHRTVYMHTGWRDINGRFAYLFNGGAIGAIDVEVELNSNLSSFTFPEKAADIKAVAQASFDLLKIATWRVTVPVLAHTYLAPLCHFLHKANIPPSFVFFLSGGTGTRKTTLAVLEMAHFGAGWSATHMPASFADSSNSLRTKAFICKDVPFLIDDFHPASSPLMKSTMNQKAHDMATAYGDYAERGRLRADLTMASAKPPRGVGLMTGESFPDISESGSARFYVVEVGRDDIPVSDSLKCTQQAASTGMLAQAMRAYIELLASSSAEDLAKALSENFTKYRCKAQEALDGAHGRLCGAAASLMLGWHYALDFYQKVGIIAEKEYEKCWEDGVQAILENIMSQSEDMKQEKPTKLFLQAIFEIIVTKKFDLNEVSNNIALPDIPLIGFYDKEYVYLLPGVAYGAVTSHYREQGVVFPINRIALNKRLAEEGYLNTHDGEGYTLGKHVAQLGTTVRMLHLKRDALAAIGCDPVSLGEDSDLSLIDANDRILEFDKWLLSM